MKTFRTVTQVKNYQQDEFENLIEAMMGPQVLSDLDIVFKDFYTEYTFESDMEEEIDLFDSLTV